MPRCFNLYICDRSKLCLYHREWTRGKAAKNNDDEFKSLYGLFFQMKLFASVLDPTKDDKPAYMMPQRIGEGTSFRTIRTNTYQVNFFEVPSGLKFILCTSPDVGNLQSVLEQLYGEVYLDQVVKDPTYTPGDVIENAAFDLLVDEFMRRHRLDVQ